ncbi:MAG: type II toxin-antitoxin system RelE/ParE family toxin [Methylobacteriaceae bacterium]|nr:type II toxin-antitoxin system RelE/ParE family toxin [Methylobacteriaceae bacterium]
MAGHRLSRLAQADMAGILAASAERWGIEARRRYAAVLAAGIRKVAAEPHGSTSRERSELAQGIRSLHLRNVGTDIEAKVRRPVHVLYYRVVRPDLVEIVRILHERMEPSRHMDLEPEE